MFTSKRNLNFSGYAAAHFDPLGLVLESIIQQTDVTTDDFMVVGRRRGTCFIEASGRTLSSSVPRATLTSH